MPLPDLFGSDTSPQSPAGNAASKLGDLFGTTQTASGGSLPDLDITKVPGETPDKGLSLFGFLGNVGEEVGAMAKGISSLVGAGVHDLTNLVVEGATLGKADTEGFVLDNIAMALPKALAADYNERYGISKFAEGDIFGGIQAVLTGLYERPLSAIGDALMVGTAAKLGAKAGILGEELGAKVLGPGSEVASSLTGSAEGIRLALSQNPVARMGQKALYDVMSYSGGPSGYIARKLGAGDPLRFIDAQTDFGAMARASTNLDFTPAGQRILRPSVTRVMEKRGVSTALAHLRLSVADRATPAAQKARTLLEAEGVDPDLAISAMHGTKSPALMDEIPSNVHTAGFTPANDFQVPETVIPASPEADTAANMAMAGTFRDDLVPLDSTMEHPLLSPHDTVGSDNARVFIKVDDPNSAAEVVRKAEAATGKKVVAKMNYGKQPGSYDLPHYFLQGEDGSVLDIAIGTEAQLDSAKAWSKVAGDIKAMEDELASLDAEMNAGVLTEAGLPDERRMAEIVRRQIELEDEVQAAQAMNANMFDYSRRLATGDPYNATLAATDQIRPITFNTVTRYELGHGLTYRKAMDRAFLAIRAEKHSAWTANIEKQLEATIAQGFDAGDTDAVIVDRVLKVLNDTLGENSPWTERVARSLRPEVIPFKTEDVMPPGLPGAGEQLGGKLATGENTILSDAQMLRGDDPAQIAKRMVDRFRAESHKAIVENGEFPGMDYQTLIREQIETGGVPMPQYFPHMKASKATGDVLMGPHDKAMRTVIEGETSRLKKATGRLYESGLMERDPVRVFEDLYRQIQQHVEFRDTMNTIVNKVGRKPPPEELATWKLRRQEEVLISRNGMNGMVDSRSQFMQLQHEGVMAGKTLDEANLDALDTLERIAQDSIGTGTDEIYAIPRHVASLMKKMASKGIMGDTFNFYYDTAMGLWKSQVLSLSPRWVVNNTLGNMVYIGVHRPGAIRDFLAQLMPGARAKFRAAFGEDALRMVERDFMHSESLLSPENRLALRAERAGNEAGMALAASPLQGARAVRGLRAVSHKVRSINTYIEDAARRGVFINEARRTSITRTAQLFESSNATLKRMADRGILSQREYDTFVREVNNTLGDYLTKTPVEANIIQRYLMPFYPFYRHTARFIARMPFEHPGKFRVLEGLNQLDRDMNPLMPDYMVGQSSVGGGVFMQLGGANPIEAVAEGYWPQVTNPLLGLAIQRTTGLDPFGHPWRADPSQVTEVAGKQYAIVRNPDGTVAGVRQLEGQWQPPLAGALMNTFMPQAGLFFNPWETSYLKRVTALSGVTLRGGPFSDYDPATSAYYELRSRLDALKRAASAPLEG